MGTKVLDALTNNKLLVALIIVALGWLATFTGRVSAVELKQAVQAEQITQLKEQIGEIKKDTTKILDRLPPKP